MSRSVLLSLGSAALLAGRAAAKQCAAFDTDGALYLFGGSSDVSLGTSDSWGSPKATTLTTTGRPPWTGTSTQCFTSQFGNTLFVVQADEKNPGDVYLFDFAKKTWSTQQSTNAPDLDGAAAVYDHDTGVIYALDTKGEMWDLDTGSLTTTASGKSIAWNDVGKAAVATSGYKPVMAEASQHIIFFGVPGVDAGTAPLFVIHFSFYQPAAQAFPSNGSSLPTQHGIVTGIPFSTTSVAGDQIFYVPDDFSASYVVSHWTNPGTVGSTDGAPALLAAADLINTTQPLAAPTSKDVDAAYAASTSSLVQLDSAGNVYYIADAIDGFVVKSGAAWTKMDYTLPGLSSSTAGSNSSSSSASGSNGTSTSSSSGTSTSSGSGSSGSDSSSGDSGDDAGSAAGLRVGAGLFAAVLGGAALLL